jgi:hypothetical protein
MAVTAWTWVVATSGLLIIGLLAGLQLLALIKPRNLWVIDNIYGGKPEATDPTAYFAFYRGFAVADFFLWAPLQLSGSIGMLLGQRWGFLFALMASVPFWYSAIPMLTWDRSLGFQRNTVRYWVLVWGIFPAYGIVEGVYCFLRLL